MDDHARQLEAFAAGKGELYGKNTAFRQHGFNEHAAFTDVGNRNPVIQADISPDFLFNGNGNTHDPPLFLRLLGEKNFELPTDFLGIKRAVVEVVDLPSPGADITHFFIDGFSDQHLDDVPRLLDFLADLTDKNTAIHIWKSIIDNEGVDARQCFQLLNGFQAVRGGMDHMVGGQTIFQVLLFGGIGCDNQDDRAGRRA